MKVEMKANGLFTMIMFVLPVLFASCEKNEIDSGNIDYEAHNYRIQDVLYPKGSKLKCVYQVYNSDSKLLRDKYTYDDLERISRVDWDYESWKYYNIYGYNSKGQLEKISKFEVYLENSPDLRQTVIYFYDLEGNKVKEQIESSTGVMHNLYQYNGKILMKKENYEEDQLKHYTIYEYENGTLVSEKFYVPDSDDYVTTKHFYDNTLLIYSITYHENPKSGFMSDERKYYDLNDNLIRTVENHPGLSSYSGATEFLVIWEFEYK